MDLESTNTLEKRRFRHSIVWCPIPLITWILPFIGHMGITDTDGNIHDFGGPYFVNIHPVFMAFGTPTKTLQLDPATTVGAGGMAWDAAVEASDAVYRNTMHNLFWNNCHNHVAVALTNMRAKGFWNMVTIWAWFTLKSSYVSRWAMVKTYLGAVLFYGFLLAIWVMFGMRPL